MPTSTELTGEQKARILDVLEKAVPGGVHIDFETGFERGGGLSLGVHPNEYPEAMYEFIGKLAEAEIALRDEGLNVRFFPDVQQRMLVVARPDGRDEIVYLSTDGTEYADLSKLLGVPESSLAAVTFEGYPYDSQEDLRMAKQDAQEEHPTADFSRIP